MSVQMNIIYVLTVYVLLSNNCEAAEKKGCEIK